MYAAQDRETGNLFFGSEFETFEGVRDYMEMLDVDWTIYLIVEID